MTENPYLPSSEGLAPSTEPRLRCASFGRRSCAYIIDIVPIVVLGLFVAHQFLGFDRVLEVRAPVDSASSTSEWLTQRKQVRDVHFLVYIAYASLLEASRWRATVGKRLLGLRVVGEDGEPLGFWRTVLRNAAKYLSLLPLGLGFFWAVWSKRRQTWHDMLAQALVINEADHDFEKPRTGGGPSAGE